MSERATDPTDLLGLVVLDARGRVLAIEPTLAALRGVDVADALGREAGELAWLDVARARRLTFEGEVLFVVIPDEAHGAPAIGALRDALKVCIESMRRCAAERSVAPAARRARLAAITPTLRRVATRAASVLSDRKNIDLRAIVDAAAAATLKTRPEGTRLLVDGPAIAVSRDDAALLEQALISVFTNAGEAVAERHRDVTHSARIAVRIERVAEAVRVEVEDGGDGISAEVASRAFDPGFTTKRGRHFGMGLSVARRIMTLLEGTIDLAPSPRGGAMVRLEWPERFLLW